MKVADAMAALDRAEQLLGKAAAIIVENPPGVLDTAASVLSDGDWRDAAGSLIQSDYNFCEKVRGLLPYGTAGDDVPDGLDAQVNDALEKCGKSLKLVDGATKDQYGLVDALGEVSSWLAQQTAAAAGAAIAGAGQIAGQAAGGLLSGLLSQPLVLALVAGAIWWRFSK